MGQSITQVDAFTNEPFCGNPAAVCLLPAARDERWMQQVAREMNLSETAFLVRRPDGFDLRWFTPLVEVDLCGHATLASAHVLWEQGELGPDETARFHTRSGLLTALRRGDWIELDFPAAPVVAAEPPAGLVEALGVEPVFAGRSARDNLIEVASEAEVQALAPDFTALRRIEARGVIVTSRASTPNPSTGSGQGFDFVSRFFGPRVGIDEDPVTGSAHCTLGPYWQERLGKTEMLAYQASARGGVVRVAVRGRRVGIAGQAITMLRGELAA
jgi:PhzF family phenazine biosynthesis protein